MTSKGEGNTAFFEFARKLKKVGMGDRKIEATLSEKVQTTPPRGASKFRALLGLGAGRMPKRAC
jgi:hypothetical protein